MHRQGFATLLSEEVVMAHYYPTTTTMDQQQPRRDESHHLVHSAEALDIEREVCPRIGFLNLCLTQPSLLQRQRVMRPSLSTFAPIKSQ